MVNSKSEFFSFREEKQNILKGIDKISDMSQTEQKAVCESPSVCHT